MPIYMNLTVVFECDECNFSTEVVTLEDINEVTQEQLMKECIEAVREKEKIQWFLVDRPEFGGLHVYCSEYCLEAVR